MERDGVNFTCWLLLNFSVANTAGCRIHFSFACVDTVSVHVDIAVLVRTRSTFCWLLVKMKTWCVKYSSWKTDDVLVVVVCLLLYLKSSEWGCFTHTQQRPTSIMTLLNSGVDWQYNPTTVNRNIKQLLLSILFSSLSVLRISFLHVFQIILTNWVHDHDVHVCRQRT